MGWQVLGTVVSLLAALGDLVMVAILVSLVRPSAPRSRHTFPRLIYASIGFFLSAAFLRVIESAALTHFSMTMVFGRIVHGLMLWTVVALAWTCRRQLTAFLSAIAAAELGKDC